jgi:predicted MPP superfamily phosphohydrolase
MNRRKFLATSLVGGACALLGGYSLFIERNIVQVNHYAIPVDDLPLAFDGFTIAHLTDLHLGMLVSASFIQGVVDRANRLRADMIVCTGDYVHARNTCAEIDTVWPILTELTARYGVCSVLGNHDHWADEQRSLYWMERSGQGLRHALKSIERGSERILIGGAGDYWEDRLGIDRVFAASDEHDCRVLLSHNPDSVDTSFGTRLSLVISGHTHGGQVVVPFVGPPMLPVRNKAYSSGLINTPKTRLFISRGIGWSIYPVRLNCYPEIAVLKLIRPGQGESSMTHEA